MWKVNKRTIKNKTLCETNIIKQNMFNHCKSLRKNESKELMDILIEGEKRGRIDGEQYAIDALKLFCSKLSQEKVNEYCDNEGHFTYVYWLLPVKIALMKHDFVWTCHELCDIIHEEDIFQSRVKYNVLDLLKKYIEME